MSWHRNESTLGSELEEIRKNVARVVVALLGAWGARVEKKKTSASGRLPSLNQQCEKDFT